MGLVATSFPAPDGPDPTVAPHRVRWILGAISASQVFQGASYMDVYKGDKVYRPTGETPPPQRGLTVWAIWRLVVTRTLQDGFRVCWMTWILNAVKVRSAPFLLRYVCVQVTHGCAQG